MLKGVEEVDLRKLSSEELRSLIEQAKTILVGEGKSLRTSSFKRKAVTSVNKLLLVMDEGLTGRELQEIVEEQIARFVRCLEDSAYKQEQTQAAREEFLRKAGRGNSIGRGGLRNVEDAPVEEEEGSDSV